MADLLDIRRLTGALASLDGWTGGTDRIHRTVRIPGPRQDEVVDAVMAAADEVNHHPTVERSGDTVRFTSWTHSQGGVTDLDVDLAGRIDAILRAAGLS